MTIAIDNLPLNVFYKRILELINFTKTSMDKRMTEAEIDLLTLFLSLPDKFSYQRFSTLAKTKVMNMAEERGWKLSRVNINNKIYALIDKGFLRRDEDGVVYLTKSLQQAIDLATAAHSKKSNFNIDFVFKWME